MIVFFLARKRITNEKEKKDVSKNPLEKNQVFKRKEKDDDM